MNVCTPDVVTARYSSAVASSVRGGLNEDFRVRVLAMVQSEGRVEKSGLVG